MLDAFQQLSVAGALQGCCLQTLSFSISISASAFKMTGRVASAAAGAAKLQ
jgi:hypothetical protein